MTNVFLQFVSIQRGDSKKYEILQLIASVLDWNDEQREKAGLVRPGTAANAQSSFLKTPPLSPFHRSPSTPTLSDAYEGSRDVCQSCIYYPVALVLTSRSFGHRFWILKSHRIPLLRFVDFCNLYIPGIRLGVI